MTKKKTATKLMMVVVLALGAIGVAGCGKKESGGKCGEYFRRLKSSFSGQVKDENRKPFMEMCETMPKEMIDCLVGKKLVMSDDCRAKVDFGKRMALEKVAGVN